jgi:hypothetical protein
MAVISRPGRAPDAGPLAGCPTPCDPDCEAACHEDHVPSYKRWHQPGWSCTEAHRSVAAALQVRFRPLLEDVVMVLNAISRDGRVAQVLSAPERAAADRLAVIARQAAGAGR